MHRMTTMKRRVIYTSDEEWADYTQSAALQGRTISGYIRMQMREPLRITLDDRGTIEIDPPQVIGREISIDYRVEPPPLEIEGVGTFNSRPFTPVPKKGK